MRPSPLSAEPSSRLDAEPVAAMRVPRLKSAWCLIHVCHPSMDWILVEEEHAGPLRIGRIELLPRADGVLDARQLEHRVVERGVEYVLGGEAARHHPADDLPEDGGLTDLAGACQEQRARGLGVFHPSPDLACCCPFPVVEIGDRLA